MIANALKLLYKDKFSTFEVTKVKDAKTSLTSSKEVPILQDIPCRCSYSTIDSAQKNDDNFYTKNQTVKIITSPEYDVKSGSKIVVTKEGGRVTTYRATGQPSVYPSHQEIIAELYEVIV